MEDVIEHSPDSPTDNHCGAEAHECISERDQHASKGGNVSPTTIMSPTEPRTLQDQISLARKNENGFASAEVIRLEQQKLTSTLEIVDHYHDVPSETTPEFKSSPILSDRTWTDPKTSFLRRAISLMDPEPAPDIGLLAPPQHARSDSTPVSPVSPPSGSPTSKALSPTKKKVN